MIILINVEINRICKSFKDFNLEMTQMNFNKGDIIGVIGPNGAGKSTFMSILYDLVKAEVAEFRILGSNYKSDRETLLNKVGYVTDKTSLFENKSIKWNQKFFSSFYSSWDSELFYSLLSKFGLDEDKSIDELSKGMRIKLHIIFALSQQPHVLLLDEPTSGIDPLDRTEISKLLVQFIEEDKSRTVIISSHISEDFDQVANVLLFMNEGKVLAFDRVENFKSKYPNVQSTSDLVHKFYVID